MDRRPSGPWTEDLADLLDRYYTALPGNRIATPVRSARAAVLLHAAIHDATALAWQAKLEHGRVSPGRAHPSVEALVPDRGVPGFPSEHAAAAIAAARVLTHLFPHEDPGLFEAVALDRSMDGVRAGLHWPEDVEVGLRIGEAVAARVLEIAATDGSDHQWTGILPQGSGSWRPTPPRMVGTPYEPAAGGWRRWVVGNSADLLPPAPPQPGSTEFELALQEVRGMASQVTEERLNRVLFWATSPPSVRWNLFTEDAVREGDLTPLRAARVHLLVSLSMYEAYVVAWKAKYHYWLLRPITADPAIQPLFPTPPHPAYPSGHSTISAAAAGMLRFVFPDRAPEWDRLANEASQSRLWGMVHYPFDLAAGKQLGHMIGERVVAWAVGESFVP